MTDRKTWTAVSPTQWVLDDGHGSLRAINLIGPYLGRPGDGTYRVTGIDTPSDHPTLEAAMAAAEASLP